MKTTTPLKSKAKSLINSNPLILFAIYKNSTFGTMRKSIGDDVAYRMGGQNIVRKKPVSVHDANTVKQQGRRNALSVLVDKYKMLQIVAKKGFVSRDAKHSAYNAFMAVNLKEAVSIVGSQALILYDKINVSKGVLPQPSISQIDTSVNGEVTFNYDNHIDNVLLFDTDSIQIVGVSKDDDVLALNTGVQLDQSNNMSFDISSFDVGSEIAVYAFFQSSDLNKTSDSVYIGSGIA